MAVYVTVVVPTAKASPLLCVDVSVAEQLSEAVGAVQETMASHSPASLDTAMSAGVSAMAGSSSSVTVTVKEADVLLPAASVAVYVTVVLPTAKEAPLLWLDVNVVTPQLSAAVGAVQETRAAQSPASLLWEMSIGMPEMLGFSSSVMVMSKEVDVLLPQSSVAV